MSIAQAPSAGKARGGMKSVGGRERDDVADPSDDGAQPERPKKRPAARKRPAPPPAAGDGEAAAKPRRPRAATPKAATAKAARATASRPRTRPQPPVEAPAAGHGPEPAQQVAATEPPERAVRRRRRRAGLRLAAVALVVSGGIAAGSIALLRAGGDVPVVRPGVPVELSAEALAERVEARGATVYWLGSTPGRELELTETSRGTFVRYLSAGREAGGGQRDLTVATYPLQNAYATATERARSEQMASQSVGGGGLAVWTRARPRSVFVAYPGKGELVEIYSPAPGEAVELARSGRLEPVG